MTKFGPALLPALLLTLPLVLPPTTAAAESRHPLTTVAAGLDNPWGLAFLPDGALLVTERPGALRRIESDGSVGEPLAGVPEVFYKGQGGLLDIALDPQFAETALVYLSYAHGDDRANATRVARAVLGPAGLEALEVILTIEPAKDTPQHYGGSLAFLPDGTLLVTTGDGFDYREAAQDRRSMLGKVLRVAGDGSIPEDNPFVGDAAAADTVWTFGHRNPQGLVVDAESGRVYLHEHGPRGGDELNLLRPGSNYGWPAVTFGKDYSGALVSPFRELPGITPPLLHWTPSIAPSGMTLYRGDRYPDWNGDLFVGALVDREVRRVRLDDGRVVEQESLFGELGERIRNVKTAPDGHLYLVTDSDDGRIIRVEATAVPGAVTFPELQLEGG